MSDALPDFAPVPLWGLSHDSAMTQAKAAGMQIARQHWCGLHIVWNADAGQYEMHCETGKVWTDLGITREDRRANDWYSEANPNAR